MTWRTVAGVVAVGVALWAFVGLVLIHDSRQEDVTCRIAPVTLTASWDDHTYNFTSVALCSNGGATLSGSRCEEDDPCWDCRTMGNLICGENKRSKQ